jgi:proteasome regulatory subunit
MSRQERQERQDHLHRQEHQEQQEEGRTEVNLSLCYPFLNSEALSTKTTWSAIPAKKQKKSRSLFKKSSPILIEAKVIGFLQDGELLVQLASGEKVHTTIHPNITTLIPPNEKMIGSIAGVHMASYKIYGFYPNPSLSIIESQFLNPPPKISFNDIGGLTHQIKLVEEAIIWPLESPEIFQQMGIDPPSGILLYGSPGTGKTMIAKAIAHEANVVFLSTVGSELVNKYIGEGAKLIKEIFKFARKKHPAIIFIDEIDSIAAKRSVGGGQASEQEVNRTLMQLLAEIDGFHAREGVRIIAATNRKDILDPALLRPGRLDRIIHIPQPKKAGRIEIFKLQTKGMSLASDVKFEAYANYEFTGAQIKAVCQEAGMNAIRHKQSYIFHHDFLAGINVVQQYQDTTNKIKKDQTLSRNILKAFATLQPK